MKTILINASAAKTGGALTILKTFLENLPKSGSRRYVVLSPLSNERNEANIGYIQISTQGIGTIFFTTLGILYYILKYKPKKVISFNNINTPFYPSRGITYFHQLKALKEYKDLKIKIYDFIITTFLKENTFIVQSELVKELFLKKYPIHPIKVISCWPGFSIPETVSLPPSISSIFNENTNRNIGLLPIAFNSLHKNVQILHSLEEFFQANNCIIISLFDEGSSPFKNHDVIINIGGVSREILFELYNRIDFLVFTSRDETVGLPVFEFMQTGKPAFVYQAPYAEGFYQQFSHPDNFILFGDEKAFKDLFLQKINTKATPFRYSEGEWNKINDLL